MRIARRSLLIAAVAMILSPPANSQHSSPPSGILVPVGDRRMHLHCLGPANSSPAIVFEAGGGGSAKDWARVRELLPANFRHCAYDRAGSGWSEAGPSPRTMQQEVFELHELLRTAKIRGPFVLAGQSIGGLLVRIYAAKYSSEVAGIVMVDPTNESSVLANARYGGWVRLREKARDRPVPEPRLEGPPPGPRFNPDDDYLPEEMQLLFLARKDDPAPLGKRPLIVLGAGKRPQPPGTTEDSWKQMQQEKDEQVRGLAGLSHNSKFILDPLSGHSIHSDNPKLVASAVEEVTIAVKKRKRLAKR